MVLSFVLMSLLRGVNRFSVFEFTAKCCLTLMLGEPLGIAFSESCLNNHKFGVITSQLPVLKSLLPNDEVKARDQPHVKHFVPALHPFKLVIEKETR